MNILLYLTYFDAVPLAIFIVHISYDICVKCNRKFVKLLLCLRQFKKTLKRKSKHRLMLADPSLIPIRDIADGG